MSNTKTKRSRWIKGTLTRPKDNPFSGSHEERAEISVRLQTAAGNHVWSMISLEPHGDGTMHYHFMAAYKHAIRDTVVKALRAHFDLTSKTNEIALGDGHKKPWVGYIGKGSPESPPDFTVYGEPDCNVDGCIRAWKKKERATKLQDYEGTSDRPVVMKEAEVTNWLIEYMTKHGYKVNFHTRLLHGIGWVEFFEAIYAEGFYDLFGERGLALAKINITDDTHYTLPMWRPCLDYIRFTDGAYSIAAGCFVPDEGEEFDDARAEMMTSFCGGEPVRIYDFPCPDPDELPTLFLELVDRMGWPLPEFRRSYGRQFQDKKRRHKGLLIHGVPHGGKSTLLEPFKDVFRSVIGEWSDDGGYAYSNIARHSRIYSEEVNVFSRAHNVNQMKKLLEGVEFSTKRKHNTPITCVPKTAMIVTNDHPPERGASVHSDAILDRLDIFKSDSPIPLDEAQVEFMNLVRKESAKVLLWATADVPDAIPVAEELAELIFEDTPVPCSLCKPGCGKLHGHKGRHIGAASRIQAI